MTHRTAPEGAWFKSSRSQENGNACVEVADLTGTGWVGIRDSKELHGPVLVASPDVFSAFIADARAGRYGI